MQQYRSAPDDETRERRIEGPPLPSAAWPTAGFAQPAGCGGATHASQIPASPPPGEASDDAPAQWAKPANNAGKATADDRLASLDYHPSLRTSYFTLNLSLEDAPMDQTNPFTRLPAARPCKRGFPTARSRMVVP